MLKIVPENFVEEYCIGDGVSCSLRILMKENYLI